MNMAIDWTILFASYKGKWVALADDEITVIASAASAKQALKLALQKGEAKPILFRVPSENLTYIGHGFGVKLQVQTD
jgi:hypothetical protein